MNITAHTHILSVQYCIHRNLNYVYAVPPEYKNPSNLLYVRRGDPILLNCTPQATSADYGPIFNTEDLNGPPSFTRVSYQWTRNGTQQSTDSPILNITMEAETEHSGVYTCTASDEVVLITAQFNVAPAKKRSSSFFIPTDYIRLPTVLTTSEKFSPLETSVNFTVLVGGVYVGMCVHKCTIHMYIHVLRTYHHHVWACICSLHMCISMCTHMYIHT